LDNEGVKAIADLAKGKPYEVVDLYDPDDPAADRPIPLLIRPDGDGKLVSESVHGEIAKWRNAPLRRSGVAKTTTLRSFVDLVCRHKDDDSAIFADIVGASPSLLAIIDYHTIERAPRFGKHRITYSFPLSPEWQAWKAQDGAPMTQGAWAAFVEERIADLSAPDQAEREKFETLFQTKIASPAELVSLSRKMHVCAESQMRESRVLQSGEVEFLFEEVHKDGSGQKLVVPGLFVVNIPLFLGGEPVRLLARLRYRINSGRVSWFYQLYRPDLAMRERLVDDLATVTAETGLPAYEGSPEV